MKKIITYSLLLAILGLAYYYIILSPSIPNNSKLLTNNLKEQQKNKKTSLVEHNIQTKITPQITEPNCDETSKIQLDAIQTKSSQKSALLSITSHNKPLPQREYTQNQTICRGIILKEIKAIEIVIEIQGKLKSIQLASKKADKKQQTMEKQTTAPLQKPIIIQKNKAINNQENQFLPGGNGPWNVNSTPPPMPISSQQSADNNLNKPRLSPAQQPVENNLDKPKLSPAQSPGFIPPPPDTPAPF